MNELTLDMIRRALYEALRESMSEPGGSYIDFSWNGTQDDRYGLECARELVDDLAPRIIAELQRESA